MGKVFLAANYVSASGNFVTPAELENSGHLQIVHLMDSGIYEEIEVQAPGLGGLFGIGGLSGGTWQYVSRDNHGSEDDDSDYVDSAGAPTDTNRYARLELAPRDGQTAEQLWQVLDSIFQSMKTNGAGIDYDYIPAQNSNSFVTSALYAAGIDVGNYITSVKPADVERFPGVSNNVLLSVTVGGETFPNGLAISINGSEGNDFLRGGNNKDTLVGGGGEDRLVGGGGDDRIVGAALSAGFDPQTIDFSTLRITAHSEWDDQKRDYLSGGEGSDILIVGGGVNAPNQDLRPEEKAARAKLDIVDGSDENFTVYAQYVQSSSFTSTVLVSAQLDSEDLSTAVPYRNGYQYLGASASYASPGSQSGGMNFNVLGDQVYDFVSGKSILYVSASFSYTKYYLFGIENYVDFNGTAAPGGPGASGDGGQLGGLADAGEVPRGWTVDGDDSDNIGLRGSLGNDFIDAGAGDDFIDAATYGGGSDVYFGGNGFDTITYATYQHDLTISDENLWGSLKVVGLDGETDYVQGIEWFISGQGNDAISGTDFDETFSGGGGNDVIDGMGGQNTLDFSMHTTAVTVQFSGEGAGSASGVESGQDGFSHIQNVTGSQGNDTIVGDEGNNTIDGQDGSDTIFADEGDDILIGGDGNDYLVGGAGADVFVINAGTGEDWINDFQVGTDKIDLRNANGPTSFSQLVAAVQEWVSGSTWIYTDETNYVRLEGVSLNSLQASDFMFA